MKTVEKYLIKQTNVFHLVRVLAPFEVLETFVLRNVARIQVQVQMRHISIADISLKQTIPQFSTLSQ